MKNEKNIFIVLIISVLLFVLLIFYGSYGRCYLGTRYSSGYSYWKFKTIKKGMTETEVLRILGNPIVKIKDSGNFIDKDSSRIKYDYSFNFHEPTNGEQYFIKTILIGEGKVVYIKDECYCE